MSLTLGEKLRQAREDRGFTLSDVAEQTRISSSYLESIENDDYRILPGGIFNKGFVKSYAKSVGISESEALAGYAALLAETSESEDPNNLKVYRPEVLTDDRSTSSMVPTVILAAVILGLMTAGILFLVNYLRQAPDSSTVITNTKPNSNQSVETSPESTSNPTGVPQMVSLKFEFKAVSQPVLVTATTDGTKGDVKIAAGTSATFEPKESLSLNYNRWNAQAVQLTINGKSITLPAAPLNPKDKRIEFTINKENIGQILSSGTIPSEVPPAIFVSPGNTEVSGNTPQPLTPVATPARPTPVPKPSVGVISNSNAATKPSPEKKPASTPLTVPKPPAANKEP